MRIARQITCAAAATMMSLAPAFAQGHGGGHASPTATHGNPHTTTTTTTTTTTAASTHGQSTHGPSSHAAAPKTTSTTTPTTTTPLNPIAQKISSHPQLSAKLTSLLPTGMTLNQASSGFRNQGQFIAALHVSKNLNIPFAQLKATMLGKSATSTGTSSSTTSTTQTTSNPMSLGQAIHLLRPTADADTEAEHATVQASVDVKTTTTTTTSTSTSTHK